MEARVKEGQAEGQWEPQGTQREQHLSQASQKQEVSLHNDAFPTLPAQILSQQLPKLQVATARNRLATRGSGKSKGTLPTSTHLRLHNTPLISHPKACFFILFLMDSSFRNNPRLPWGPKIARPVLGSGKQERREEMNQFQTRSDATTASFWQLPQAGKTRLGYMWRK